MPRPARVHLATDGAPTTPVCGELRRATVLPLTEWQAHPRRCVRCMVAIGAPTPHPIGRTPRGGGSAMVSSNIRATPDEWARWHRAAEVRGGKTADVVRDGANRLADELGVPK